MASAASPVVQARAISPVHAVLLAGMLPLFLGVLLSDIAYSASYEIQWKNFASWLLVGGLVFGGFALLWSLVDLIRRRRTAGPAHRGRSTLYFLLLLATWILGFINVLVHAKDAWASMPSGLILSAIVTVLALAAVAVGFSSFRGGRP